jgi:hypothetical protein
MPLDSVMPAPAEVDPQRVQQCTARAVPTCMVWLDSRYQSHLHGTPDDPDGWACEVCRQALGWPMLGAA